jgi:hypothetical protein
VNEMGPGLIIDLRCQLSNLSKFQIEMKHAHDKRMQRTAKPMRALSGASCHGVGVDTENAGSAKILPKSGCLFQRL